MTIKWICLWYVAVVVKRFKIIPFTALRVMTTFALSSVMRVVTTNNGRIFDSRRSFIVTIIWTSTINSVWYFTAAHLDRDAKVIINGCDICNVPIPEPSDDLQYQIDKLNEIDNSFGSEYDKRERKLLFCIIRKNKCKSRVGFSNFF